MMTTQAQELIRFAANNYLTPRQFRFLLAERGAKRASRFMENKFFTMTDESRIWLADTRGSRYAAGAMPAMSLGR